MQPQPDGNHHCIQFWRQGTCQWVGRCRFPHQCYICGSPAHGTGQHSMAAAGGLPAGGMPDAYGGYGAPAAAPGYGMGMGAVPAPAGGPVAGDWQCTSCGWGNYPERQSCRKCQMPRPAEATQALATAGALLAPPDGKQHCIQFWRTGACQWIGRCRYPHQCYICGSPAHGTGQHASMAVATAGATAAVASVGEGHAPMPSYEPAPYADPSAAAYGDAAAAAYADPAPAPGPALHEAVEVPLAAAAPLPAADAPLPAEPPAADGAAPPADEAPPAGEPGAGEERGRARSRSRSASPGKRAAPSRSRSRSGQRPAPPEDEGQPAARERP